MPGATEKSVSALELELQMVLCCTKNTNPETDVGVQTEY